jgi:uncharacterized NAD(P)/FAD-binding protein YdhS
MFGRYLTDLAEAFLIHLRTHGINVTVHTNTEVIAINRLPSSSSSSSPLYELQFRGGRSVHARSIILGVGHIYSPSSSLPSRDTPGYFAIPYPPQPIIEAASQSEIKRVLVLGNGLTAIDAALTVLENVPHVEV